MSIKGTGTVDIHGRSYETVASRVQRFRKDYAEYSIITTIVDRDENQVVVKAMIVDKEGRQIATGHAEESRTSSQINRTSALENCETSAIGRALATFGMGGTEFASADEVANAIQQQNEPPRPIVRPADKPSIGTASITPEKLEAKSDLATPIQKRQILSMFRALHVEDKDMARIIREDYHLDPDTMTKTQAAALLKELQ